MEAHHSVYDTHVFHIALLHMMFKSVVSDLSYKIDLFKVRGYPTS